jgi:hypothetical protein
MDTPEEIDIPALKSKLLEALGGDASAYPVAIEQKFPRIFAKIVNLWGRAGLDALLDDLMVSDRPGRQGFPDDVAREIFRLSMVHGALGLTKQRGAFGWSGIDDPELYKKEFTKGH